MNAHTPGPWKAHDASCEITATNSESLITRVVARVASNKKRAANARLIAAAPDLLAACQLALGAFERNDAIDWSVLEKAIAHATGSRHD